MRLNRLIISIAVVAVVLSALPSSASEVISCDVNGTPKEEFCVSEAVYITATGLMSSAWHFVIIQDHPVDDGVLLNITEDPSEERGSGHQWTKVDFFLTNGTGCSNQPIKIWEHPSGTEGTYDIVANAFGVSPLWTYNSSIDGLDSVGVSGGGGFLAPVPELPTLILTAIGLIGLIALGRRR